MIKSSPSYSLLKGKNRKEDRKGERPFQLVLFWLKEEVCKRIVANNWGCFSLDEVVNTLGEFLYTGEIYH